MSDDLTKTLTYRDPRPHLSALAGLSGLEQFQAFADGTVPSAPISAHMNMELSSFSEGDVVFKATPEVSHYNPIGAVHGGFVATLLDSACGCAVHTTLPAGVGYTSLEIKISFLRGITADSGPVFAHGWVTRAGRRAAFAEADVRDADGRVLATATSTCLVISA